MRIKNTLLVWAVLLLMFGALFISIPILACATPFIVSREWDIYEDAKVFFKELLVP